jgi:excisionase family DNA binding protein
MSAATAKASVPPADRNAPLLDTAEVAEALSVTPRRVRRLVAERRIPFVKVGRFVRFEPGELDAWLQQLRVHAVHRGSRVPGTAGR